MNMNPKLALQMVKHFGERNFPMLTDKLYSMYAERIELLEPEQYPAFMEQMDKQWQLAKELMAEINKISPAHKRVETLHALVDELASEAKKEATCKRGCSFCCHISVDITNDEARVLKHLWDGSNLGRLKKQARVKDMYSYLKVLSYEDGACVFLKDSECSIYDQRPAACRTHYSASEPELCNPQSNPGGKVALFVDSKVEMLKTVMYSTQGCAPMAKQLLK